MIIFFFFFTISNLHQTLVLACLSLYPSLLINHNKDIITCVLYVCVCRFLLEALKDLDSSLKKLNSRLFVVRGQPTDVFPRLFKVCTPGCYLSTHTHTHTHTPPSRKHQRPRIKKSTQHRLRTFPTKAFSVFPLAVCLVPEGAFISDVRPIWNVSCWLALLIVFPTCTSHYTLPGAGHIIPNSVHTDNKKQLTKVYKTHAYLIKGWPGYKKPDHFSKSI